MGQLDLFPRPNTDPPEMPHPGPDRHATAASRGDSPISNDGLAVWLEFAVPLTMLELAILPDFERAARTNAWLADAAPALGAADAMMFPGRKRGRAEVSATGLAKGIAAAAAINGKVEVLGLTFVWPGARPPAVTDPAPVKPQPRPIKVVELPEADL